VHIYHKGSKGKKVVHSW